MTPIERDCRKRIAYACDDWVWARALWADPQRYAHYSEVRRWIFHWAGLWRY